MTCDEESSCPSSHRAAQTAAPHRHAPGHSRPRVSGKPSADDQKLANLREEFTGHRIWRSPRWDGGFGCWVATLHDPAQGVDPTVIRDTGDQLWEALLEERELAERRGDRL
ncbi:hypothetical protein [Actinomadura logoneensis]|uniref:hypothetical protein n=1 Tax=Actinomadura logoneensis TaxID=2293572 RepID=UPI0011C1CE7F|nr:hypothetical protein [Actinomadura logoneensis]